jgi:hypothetical protein
MELEAWKWDVPTSVLYSIELRYDVKNLLVSVQATSYKLKGNQ